jgi:AcrR family transcriptional regulator
MPEHVRRAVVLDAAVAHFADQGRTGTTIDDIADATGVRKPAIYEMFGSKDDLFRAAVDHVVTALSAQFRVTNAETADLAPAERTRARIDAALAHAERDPQSFRLLLRAPYSWPDDDPTGAQGPSRHLVQVMADNYRRESKAAGTPIDDAAEVLARLFFTMTYEIIRLQLTDATWNRDALVELLAQFIDGGTAAVRPDVWHAIDRRDRAAATTSLGG